MSRPESPPKRFRSLADVYRASFAQPAPFALPVALEEDAEAISIGFELPESEHVCVKARDHSIVLSGPENAVRFCAWPPGTHAGRLETLRRGDVLHIRIPKKPTLRESGGQPSSNP